jgi:hypothetical protein
MRSKIAAGSIVAVVILGYGNNAVLADAAKEFPCLMKQ